MTEAIIGRGEEQGKGGGRTETAAGRMSKVGQRGTRGGAQSRAGGEDGGGRIRVLTGGGLVTSRVTGMIG